MPSTPVGKVLRFGVFELDSESGELRRHGLRIRLPEQSFQILKTLLRRPGEVVTRHELRHVLWAPETFVDFEVGLNSAVRKLREALDDAAENPRFIETVPRRGYRFVATVTEPPGPPAPLDSVAEPGTAPVSEGEAATRQSSVPLSAPAPAARLRTPFPASRAAGLLLIVVLTGAAIGYQRRGVTALPAAATAAPIRSIVVLPFDNLTGDASHDYLVENVTDAVTSQLAQVAGLDVISRTSARQYKQSTRRLPEIGSELKVDGVVEGAVVRTGSAVRITATLIRAATDTHVWAGKYDGDIRQITSLQQRIASDVAVAVGLPASSALRRAPRAIDAQAYDAYLKALIAKGQQRHESVRAAVTYLEEAVAIQPDFAEAYAELALTQVQFLFGGPLSPRETIPKAESAARKALQLDDTLPRAHWALGQILSLYYWRWADGEQALQRATELQGTRDELAAAVSESLIRRGRFAEALATAERGRRLDPLSVNAQVAVGSTHRAAGHHERAIEELRQALRRMPGNTRVQFQLGATFAIMGRPDDAIRELEVAARPARGHSSRLEAYLGYAYAAAGRTDEARAVLRELESHRQDQYVSSFGIALIHDALGEKEPALAALERACEDRAVEFAQMAQYPAFTVSAADPRYRAVMRHVGLPR